MSYSNQEKVVKTLLESSSPINSFDISFKIGTSERTVRNSINSINSLNNCLILHNKEGYYIENKEKAKKLLEKEDNKLLTQSQREELILKELLQNNSINYFEVAETLFVSEHTIEADLIRLKNQLIKYNLELIKHKEEYHLIGQEEDKRKLLSKLIYDDSKGLVNDYLNTLNKEYNTDNISKKIKEVLLKHKLKYNSYTLNNLIVHVIVYIDRLSSSNTTKLDYKDVKETSDEYIAANELASWLSNEYLVEINDNEIRYLSVILRSKTTNLKIDSISSKDTSNKINFVDLTKEIIDSLNSAYDLNINNEEFFSRFLLHIYELNKRIELNRLAKNPFSSQMKNSYPFIYETGVFISNILLKHGLQLDDDEITYLAFHIGSFIEGNQNKKIINIALYVPEYINMAQVMEKKIRDNINIEANIDCLSEIDNLKNEYDLIISPIDLKDYDNKFIKVNPFISDNDIKAINDKIKVILKDSNLDLTRFNSFCSDSFFIHEHYEKSVEDMIRYMCSLLEKSSIVDSNFVESVLQRESLSSTSYMNNIALPHSLSPLANKASICVVLNKKPMSWNGNMVNIIILVAGSKNNRFLFRELTDSLTNKIYNSDRLVSNLLDCENYKDFLKKIFE